MTDELHSLQAVLREFSRARDWEQFHSPKNLASALSVEAAELLEHFQWLTEEQSRASETTRFLSLRRRCCYVYFVDKAAQEYFKHRIKRKPTDQSK